MCQQQQDGIRSHVRMPFLVMDSLNTQQRERYKRHLLLPEIGEEGQRRLLSASVLVVGVGGLGSPVCLYLAAAGVGRIGLVDADSVDLSNLQRQVIHTTEDIGVPKVVSAKQKIGRLNPDVDVVTYAMRLDASNARGIISGYDFVVSATDNPKAKQLVSDTCVSLHKPFSHGGIQGFTGQTFTYTPGSACLRCIFGNQGEDDAIATAAPQGVLGAIAGMLGTIQAAEAVKYVTGAGRLLTNRLMTFNALNMAFRTMNVSPSKCCPVCGSGDAPK